MILGMPQNIKKDRFDTPHLILHTGQLAENWVETETLHLPEVTSKQGNVILPSSENRTFQ